MGEALYTTSVSGNRGVNKLVWEAHNNVRQAVASGLYVYTLEADNGYQKTKRMTGKIAIIR